ncbi:MAG: hypothetical protein LC785_14760 [Acidobacteria bacterium]|nr:hypothetical protein [Acidobacteriota bacterium]MCA1643173.1 hypothetical protein [Acidobacteriota bacterium]
MKLLFAPLLFAAATTVAAAAQDTPSAAADAPGVVVVKSVWSKERLNWERDPFAGPLENFDEMRARARNEKRIDDAKRGGSQSDIDKATREARADAANVAAVRKERQKPARYVFMYKVSLRNGGAKPIRAIDWDYAFFEKGTAREVGRLQFTSEEKIAPGKSKELKVVARQPPAQTVSVHALGEREHEALDGRIELVRVEYADGSVWKRP